MRKKKIKRGIKWLVLLLVLVALLNFNLILFSCNLRKTIKPDFSVSDVTVSDLGYLFDESNPINLVDVMYYGELSFIDGMRVLLNPDEYCFVTVKLEISNNTGKDIYDWDYCVHPEKTLFYAVSVNDTESPLFCPILDGEKSVIGISIIVPRDSINFDNHQSTDEVIPSSFLKNFSIKVKAADLRKDWNYDEFYGE